ncbi:MAG: Gfo/Idh/MocA family oxidoreductase [Williamsia sp.]|nr:Gfo/Idh/MocA family oxidoreductase [Williamsia sp.]
MKRSDRLLQSLLGDTAFNRRKFLGNACKGIVGATVIGEMAALTLQAQEASTGPTKAVNGGSDTTPIQLKPRDAATERKEEPVPSPLDPNKRVRYAIVGLGALSLNQIMPAFGECKYSKPVALVSGMPDKARKVASQYGIAEKNIYNYQNYDQIKNNPEIDAVYIVLPNGMHEEYTVRAAQAGKHVLCEKPMANNSKEAQRMIDACKKAGKKLMIAYRIQYEPNNRKAMEWVRNKQYGTVKLIDAVNTQNAGDPSQWRLKKALAGGGSLPDIGLYCLNTSRFLLGEEPESVISTIYSTPGDERFREVEETVLFQMRFPSGALVNASTSYGVHESRRYRCHGDKGGWFGLDPAFAYEGLKMELSQALDKSEWRQNPSFGQKNQFTQEIDHMSLCVLGNKDPYTPGEEGLQDHRIMEAIYQSAQEGKPIKLEKIAKLDAFRGTPPKPD